MFGGKTGDLVDYFTYGLFSHGGVVGLTNKTREHDNVVRYLNGFARHQLGREATWSSVSLSYNVRTEVHHDYHNLRGTNNYTISIGQDRGDPQRGSPMEEGEYRPMVARQGPRHAQQVQGVRPLLQARNGALDRKEMEPDLSHYPQTSTRPEKR